MGFSIFQPQDEVDAADYNQLTRSEECEKNFKELKNRLTAAPILTLPSESGGFMIITNVFRSWIGLHAHAKR